jgi:hypothetical protein
MWLVFQGRYNLQAGVLLGGMKWKGDTRCVLCGVPETVDHIFFFCLVARLVWGGMKEAFCFDRHPSGLSDLLDNSIPLGCKKYSTKLFSLAMVFWLLWTSRNKMVMEGVVLRRPADMFHNIFSCTQIWLLRLKPSDQEDQVRWVA